MEKKLDKHGKSYSRVFTEIAQNGRRFGPDDPAIAPTGREKSLE